MSIVGVTHNFGSASRGIDVRLDLGWRDCLTESRIQEAWRQPPRSNAKSC